MQVGIFIVLLAGALAATGYALRLATSVNDRSGIAFSVGLASGGLVLWLLVTVSAFNVVVVEGGNENVFSYPSLGVLGVLGVGVSVLIVGRGSIELLAD